MLPLATILFTSLFGAAFGAWAASLVGAALPNSQLRRFHPEIERGRVLKAGNLDDLLVQNEATRTIVIRTLDAIDALHRSLLELPGTRDVRVDDDEVTVDYAGTDAEASALLIELIRRGHRIAEFRQQRANLEQLFMNFTTGGVQ